MSPFFRTLLIVIAIPAIVAVSFVAGVFTHQTVSDNPQFRLLTRSAEDPAIQKVDEVIDLLDQQFVEDVSEDVLIEGALKGIIEALDDPFSRYLGREAFQDIQAATAGSYKGIGVTLGPKNGKFVVVTVFDDTPAQESGLKAGDEFTKVEDEPIEGMDIETLVSLIRGEPGTKVTLTMTRPGEDDYTVDVERRDIEIPLVRSDNSDGGVGYVQLFQFSEGAAEQVREHIDQVIENGAKGILLDLRGNPGGLLDQAIDVTSIFIDEGEVVSTKGKLEPSISYKVNGGAIDQSIPLVILQNSASASASEIVAGAIQDHDRGTIVGTNSYGKASVQQVLPFGDESGGIVVTTAKYFTPSGKDIVNEGIKPDIEVTLDSAVTNDVSLDPDTGEEITSPHIPEDPDDDNQLHEAERILREIIESDKRG